MHSDMHVSRIVRCYDTCGMFWRADRLEDNWSPFFCMHISLHEGMLLHSVLVVTSHNVRSVQHVVSPRISSKAHPCRKRVPSIYGVILRVDDADV